MEEQYIQIHGDGNKYYYKDKAKTILHRLDGPAVITTEGVKAWWTNGKLHRLDGPAAEHAAEYADGDKSWYVNGIFIMTVDKEGTVVDRMV